MLIALFDDRVEIEQFPICPKSFNDYMKLFCQVVPKSGKAGLHFQPKYSGSSIRSSQDSFARCPHHRYFENPSLFSSGFSTGSAIFPEAVPPLIGKVLDAITFPYWFTRSNIKVDASSTG